MSLLDALIDEGVTNPTPLASGQVRREAYITIRNDGVIGSGTPDDPYNGSTPDLLDDLLNDVEKIAANMTIRFGPGIFRTRGGHGSSHAINIGWLPQSGQKFIGSGMYQTVLQLSDTAYDTLGNEVPGEKIPIFGNNLPILDGLEVSDMTLDCNLSRLPVPSSPPGIKHPPIAVIGAELYGNHIAFRRVRVINWGTFTPGYIYGVVFKKGESHECFPLFIAPHTGSAR